MTIVNPVSWRFGAVKVDDMLEKQRRDFFLTTGSVLAIVYSCHRFSSLEMLADSGEPGNKWASLLIWMTVIKARGSQPLTHNELLKLSRPANGVTELALQDTRPVAVIKSPVHYSKNFE